MVNPQAVDDELGEWVELYNTASHPIDIVMLCADLDPTVNGGVPCDGWFLRSWNGGGLALANGPYELMLSRPDGLEIDWLYYGDTWFTTAIAHGVTQAALDAGDNDASDVWCNQTTITPPMREPRTPGFVNDPC